LSLCVESGVEVVKSIRYGLPMEEDPAPAEELSFLLLKKTPPIPVTFAIVASIHANCRCP
jgi:hypothetical protein